MRAVTSDEIRDCLDNAIDILRAGLPEFTDRFRASVSTDNFYEQSGNVEWTTGFCTGTYWLAYEHTGDDAFRDAALTQVDSFLRRIEERVDVDHHDMGFLYTPSCVAAYRLAGSETGRRAALLAAENLMRRFHEKGQFFQAWGKLGEPENYRMIIDCLLNLPLLYWASGQTGNPVYAEKARAHARTSLENLVRPDSSTYHTYFFDAVTGRPLRGVTAQGYRNDSAWARGQAWGVYGLALCCRQSRDCAVMELFRRVTDFFIGRLPGDMVPFWDLDFTAEDCGEPRDSSAAAIAACGMLEMSKYMTKDAAEYYTAAAEKTAASLAKNYASRGVTQSNGLLLHGVYAKSSPFNTVTDRGVDECSAWGDYFWLELLTRLSKPWEPYW